MLSDQRVTVSTSLLSIDCETTGDPSGPAVILLHGFPYDVRAYDEVAEIVGAAGARVIAPYLRGFGRTRFLDEGALRSGQQAALGQDLIDLLDALDIDLAVVAGYDWGGRAACIAAALFPDRVTGLVTVGGYNIQDIAQSGSPTQPTWEKTYWYQYYFHSGIGHLPGSTRRGLFPPRRPLSTTPTSWTSSATSSPGRTSTAFWRTSGTTFHKRTPRRSGSRCSRSCLGAGATASGSGSVLGEPTSMRRPGTDA